MKGLTNEEAKRRLTEGKNKLTEEKQKSLLVVFLDQFKDLLVAILIIAAGVSAFSGNAESAMVIFAVLILNAVLGTVQHRKAEKSLASLKAMSAPITKVMRDGVRTEIPSEDIVLDDIVILEAGDFIPADGRIIENHSLKVNEAVLTGESVPSEKTEGDAVYSGSLVTYGRAEIVVTATGMNTEIGKIAGLMNATKQRKTPLQKSLDDFSKKLAAVIVVLCGVVYLLSIFRSGMEPIDALLFAIALAVAAIPEALSSIVTIVLAIGTQKMAKHHAIIKDLKAVESLGCVSVICSDKTGTLTQNKMTVQKFVVDGEIIEELSTEKHDMLIKAAVLCSDATTEDKDIGDPTEVALIRVTDELGIDETVMRAQYPRIAELAFDSDRKLMSTLCRIGNKTVLFTKGAVDIMLKRCSNADIEAIEKANEEFSAEGLRVLAFGYKETEKETVGFEDEDGLTFIGLVAMKDPPRLESEWAVREAKRAGIRTVMITGDHKITATAIAKQIGIFHEHDIALEGAELDNISNEELDRILPHISVYARVKPEHKIRIVEAWQRHGKIVAMTGDGVNDAPALKKADIGVAMGITGTAVSKDAASMILANDNFATIVKAVENGRAVYQNIKNSIAFLLSGNTAGIFCVLFAAIIGTSAPFEAVHLLFMNLLTDSLPAIAIGMDKPSGYLMNKKPRDPHKSILDKKLTAEILINGGMIAVMTMMAYHIGLCESEATAMTMAFATLTLARLFHSFGHISVIKDRPNKYLIGAFIFGVALLSAVLLIPALGSLFSVAPLTRLQFGEVIFLSMIPSFFIQFFNTINGSKKQ